MERKLAHTMYFSVVSFAIICILPKGSVSASCFCCFKSIVFYQQPILTVLK